MCITEREKSEIAQYSESYSHFIKYIQNTIMLNLEDS